MTRILAIARVAQVAAAAATVVMTVYQKRRSRRRSGNFATRTENGLSLGTLGSSDVDEIWTYRQMHQSDPSLQQPPSSTVPKTATFPTGSGPRSYSTSSSITLTLGEGIRRISCLLEALRRILPGTGSTPETSKCGSYGLSTTINCLWNRWTSGSSMTRKRRSPRGNFARSNTKATS